MFYHRHKLNLAPRFYSGIGVIGGTCGICVGGSGAGVGICAGTG